MQLVRSYKKSSAQPDSEIRSVGLPPTVGGAINKLCDATHLYNGPPHITCYPVFISVEDVYYVSLCSFEYFCSRRKCNIRIFVPIRVLLLVLKMYRTCLHAHSSTSARVENVSYVSLCPSDCLGVPLMITSGVASFAVRLALCARILRAELYIVNTN